MNVQQPSPSELEATIQEAVAAAREAAAEAVRDSREAAADARELARDAREQAREAREGTDSRDGSAQTFNVRIGDSGLVIPRVDAGGNTVEQPFDPSTLIPPQATDLLLISVLGVVGIILAFPIGRAIARYIDRRGTTAPVSGDVTQRLVAIEQAVDAVAIEMERLSEANRFTTKLLSERVGAPDFAAARQGETEAHSVSPRG